MGDPLPQPTAATSESSARQRQGTRPKVRKAELLPYMGGQLRH